MSKVPISRQKNRSAVQQGFTLVELMVSLFLMGFVLITMMTLNSRSMNTAAVMQIKTDLTSETQIAQNYLASKIKTAVYIYPMPTTGTASSIAMATSGYSTYNPRKGSYGWRLGAGTLTTDPIMAMVLPPRTPTATSTDCGTATAMTSTTTAQQQARQDAIDQSCYAFYVYYAIPRSQLTNWTGAGTAPSGPNKLDADSANDSTAWVLMEYRAYYDGSTTYTPGTPPSTSSIPTGNSGRLVMDYLAPTTETGTDRLFVVNNAPGVTPVQPISVTISLAASRQVGSRVIRVPGTGQTVTTVYPRNLGAS